MKFRQQIQLARAEFMHRSLRVDEHPTVLFLSVGFHSDLCAELTEALGQELKTVHGAQMYGMQVHLVPSLESGFHIA